MLVVGCRYIYVCTDSVLPVRVRCSKVKIFIVVHVKRGSIYCNRIFSLLFFCFFVFVLSGVDYFGV